MSGWVIPKTKGCAYKSIRQRVVADIKGIQIRVSKAVSSYLL